MNRLHDDLARWLEGARARSTAVKPAPRLEQIGRVERVGDGVAVVSGLADARQDELLRLGDDLHGLAVTLDRASVGCVLLSPWETVAAGFEVRGTGGGVKVPVGEALLGRIVDPLGRPLDGGRRPEAARLEAIDRPAPAIVDRDLVTVPLQTGITVIDAMIPLGRGQRELIIGDRKTGKTAVAVDAIINQRDSDVVCVYVAVGQKASSVNQVIDAVRRHGAPERCVFVIGEADSAPGLQWIAPYAACTIAEYFRDRGGDALLVIDDLTKHAVVYRTLSLLLRRPPGREAYPGDIFYIHARLLERAARLAAERGGGSLTALPIAETQAGNLSAYIPTNLISITDGQIYLEPKLFNEGLKPAVNVGKSVSRVGGRTQAPAIKALTGSLRLDYTQFLELEVFTRFGATVDEATGKAVEHGRRIRAILNQRQCEPLPLGLQVALLLAVGGRALDPLPVEAVEVFKGRLKPWLDARCRDVVVRITRTGRLADGDRLTLDRHVRALAAELAEG
ncbi:MAG: F0F1 ATP synthase subunit alpha [Rhodospirillales bacterium]